MKKMTLSAALLAVVLMGCSESGLDNSVASTSDVKAEPAFLARTFLQDFHQGQGAYPIFDNVLHVNTYEEGNHGAGEYYFPNGPLPSVANVLTVAVAYCEYDPNDHVYGYSCAKHSAGFESGVGLTPIDPLNSKSTARNVKAYTGSLENVPVGGIGVVSSISVVWNQGASNEDIFGVSLYSGPLNQNTAMKVYQKYLLQAHDNILNNRCIDWMPDQDPCYYPWH